MVDKWDYRFLDMADFVSSWSKDPTTKVGAVITDHRNRIVSLGFNGFPQGVEDNSRLDDREVKNLMVIHAEMNAAIFAGRDLSCCRIYVTRPPCASCASQLIQLGITEVYYYAPPAEFTERWADRIRIAKDMFGEAGIAVAEVFRPSTP